MALTALQRKENLKTIAASAVQAESSSGVPAELIAAQCILESGWLEHAPGNNPFGIKALPNFGRQLLDTTEWFTQAELAAFLAPGDGRTATVFLKNGVPQTKGTRTFYKVKDWFAKFGSLADAFVRHAELLLKGKFYGTATSRYQIDKDLAEYVEAIAKNYATAPDYAASVKAVINSPNVQAALRAARKNA